MRRMRSNNRVFATLALCAAVGRLRRARGRRPERRARRRAGPRSSSRFGVAKVADWAERTADRERRCGASAAPRARSCRSSGRSTTAPPRTASAPPAAATRTRARTCSPRAGTPGRGADRRGRDRGRQRRRPGQLRPPLRRRARAHLRLHAHDRAGRRPHRRAGAARAAARRGRLHRLLLGRPPALRGPRRPRLRGRGRATRCRCCASGAACRSRSTRERTAIAAYPRAAHGPHPQLLDHRPHRPRQVDAGRSHPRAHRGGRPAQAHAPAARLDGPRARARDHDQGPGGAGRLRRATTARPTTCT